MFDKPAVSVEVFSKDGCPWCDDVRAFLTEKGVPFTETKLNDDAERNAMYDSLGLKDRRRTVPQVVIVDADGERLLLGGAAETKKSGVDSLLSMMGKP